MSSSKEKEETATEDDPSKSIERAVAATPIVSVGQRRKSMFGDCALVEIIHLHDCLRGALKALEKDVTGLLDLVVEGKKLQDLKKLEGRVAGRFKVIWSVFRAHSSAEDEFIWPALQSKTEGRVKGSPVYLPGEELASRTKPVVASTPQGKIEQEEYEEDHADEEKMFSFVDDLLTKLRDKLQLEQQKQHPKPESSPSAADAAAASGVDECQKSIHFVMKQIHERTVTLSQHLMAHLAKEENECLPLVVNHLSKSEIHDLVGKIMGKRSSDMIAQIMSMAVQNLNDAEREEMVRYMQQAMEGTFFDRWLSMSGWMNDNKNLNDDSCAGKKRPAAVASNATTSDYSSSIRSAVKRIKTEDGTAGGSSSAYASLPSRGQVLPVPLPTELSNPAAGITSQAELEKLIRAIATNPNLSARQKNTTIQGLRDSVWKTNQKLKCKSEDGARSAGGAATMGAAFASR